MKYANHYSHTDIDPFEIVNVVSDKTMDIREMDAAHDDSTKLDFHVGGFSAICSNQREQKWFISSNAQNQIIRIRLSKSGIWKDKHGRKFKLNDQPIKFYDYNF